MRITQILLNDRAIHSIVMIYIVAVAEICEAGLRRARRKNDHPYRGADGYGAILYAVAFKALYRGLRAGAKSAFSLSGNALRADAG